MSSHNEQANVFLPQSIVKSPGIMFKDKKDPSEVRISSYRIHTLLRGFQATLQSPFSSFANIPAIPSHRPSTFMSSKLRMEKFLKSNSANSVTSPGKLKTVSDKVSHLIQKAQQIFIVYDLELVVEDSKISKDVYNLFKVLVPEICFFPSNFFQKIQMKQLLIYKEDNFSPTAIERNVSLCVSSLDTKQKVRQRLYKIIFDNIILTNSDIIRKWSESEPDNSPCSSPADQANKLEELFIALMSNTNHALLRAEPKKLRELLTNYYPEAMSEERFRKRNKENKRSFRVRFEAEANGLQVGLDI